MASDDKFLFLIYNDEILFNNCVDILCHKDWAKTLGIVGDEFCNIVRGKCVKADGKWHADFYYDYDREDGRCAAAARKFAPVIMKKCKTSSLEVLSDEEPFTIRKEDYHHNNTK